MKVDLGPLDPIYTSGVIGTLPRSKEHFLLKLEKIDFYTISRSFEVGTHPLASKEYFWGQKNILKIKPKCHLCHISKAG